MFLIFLICDCSESATSISTETTWKLKIFDRNMLKTSGALDFKSLKLRLTKWFGVEWKIMGFQWFGAFNKFFQIVNSLSLSHTLLINFVHQAILFKGDISLKEKQKLWIEMCANWGQVNIWLQLFSEIGS